MPARNDPHPDLQIDQIVNTFNKYGVEYVVVGGVGAMLHGAKKETLDFDAVVNMANDNIERLVRALDELGAYMRVSGAPDYEIKGLTFNKKWFVTSQNVTNWRTPVGDIDIMCEMPDAADHGNDYHTLMTNADKQKIRSLQVWVAGLDDIIASKKFADRPKDQEALPELQRLAQIEKGVSQKKATPPMQRKTNRPPLER